MSIQGFCRPPDKGVANEVSGGFFQFRKSNPPLALLASPLIRGAKR